MGKGSDRPLDEVWDKTNREMAIPLKKAVHGIAEELAQLQKITWRGWEV